MDRPTESLNPASKKSKKGNLLFLLQVWEYILKDVKEEKETGIRAAKAK